MLRLIIVHYIIFLLHTRCSQTAKIDYRLPKTLKPTKYDLELAPNFENDTFVGSVKIYMTTLKDTTNVTIHKRNINITEDSIQIAYDSSTDYQFRSSSIAEETEKEFFIMTFLPGLRKGSKYIITISNFVGKMNTETRGFYVGYLENSDGELRKFAASQFAPTNAREAFPCFDEPEYKAILNLKINRPDETYVTVANGIRDSSSSNGLTDVFTSTPPMSTYLYAFVISEMRLSDLYAKIRILAKPEDLKNNKHMFALEKSQTIFSEIQKFLNVSYGMEKLDHASMPDEYFSVGTKGNWGLITYKESRLLSTEESDVSDKQTIITTVAHEIAYQWFGNSVTPSWWTYLWLSEGFATFLSNYVVDWVEPNMNLIQQFVVKSMHNALYLDSLDSTRPMNMDGNTIDEIHSHFDSITYDKGASIIRMVEGFLTKSVFKKTLNAYLDNTTFTNSTPSDLYRNIQSILDNVGIEIWDPPLNIASIMSSWDSTPGYPVVTVTRQYGNGENNIHLRQERFVLNDSIIENGTWKIPINFYSIFYPNITLPSLWLSKTEENTSYHFMNDDDWLIANVKQTGFYRVNYDERNWALIRDGLIKQHKNIDVLNRAQIIDDSFNLARSGRLDYTVPIHLSTYLKQERNYIPFYPFLNSIKFLNNMLQDTNTFDPFKEYTLDVLNNIYDYLRFEDSVVEEHTDILNRVQILTWLCRLGHSECRSTCLNMFRTWKNGSKRIPINLESSVFCGAMRTATESDHSFLLSKLSNDIHLRSRIIYGLGCSENVDILVKYLDSSLNDSSTLSPKIVVQSVYDKSSVGLQTALDFLENNFVGIHYKSTNVLKTVIKGISEMISTDNQYKQFKVIADKSGDRDLFENALSVAASNIQWISKKNSEISAALNVLKGTESSGQINLLNYGIIGVCLLCIELLRYFFFK